MSWYPVSAIMGRFTQSTVGQSTISGTRNQSLRVAQCESPGDDITRAGNRFKLASIAATGIAPVQAVPTTAAQWGLYNGAANTTTAFLDRIGMMLNSGTAGAGGVLLAALCPPANVPATFPVASDAAIQISNASSISAKSSKLIVASAKTLVLTTNFWFPIAAMNPVGTVLGQTIFDSGKLDGTISIPPGCALGLAVVSPTGTTPLFAPWGEWHEYAADNE
ncbi:MAG: hypothetical protein ACLP1X_28465 [Polyangiaceae bacterium]